VPLLLVKLFFYTSILIVTFGVRMLTLIVILVLISLHLGLQVRLMRLADWTNWRLWRNGMCGVKNDGSGIQCILQGADDDKDGFQLCLRSRSDESLELSQSLTQVISNPTRIFQMHFNFIKMLTSVFSLQILEIVNTAMKDTQTGSTMEIYAVSAADLHSHSLHCRLYELKRVIAKFRLNEAATLPPDVFDAAVHNPHDLERAAEMLTEHERCDAVRQSAQPSSIPATSLLLSSEPVTQVVGSYVCCSILVPLSTSGDPTTTIKMLYFSTLSDTSNPGNLSWANELTALQRNSAEFPAAPQQLAHSENSCQALTRNLRTAAEDCSFLWLSGHSGPRYCGSFSVLFSSGGIGFVVDVETIAGEISSKKLKGVFLMYCNSFDLGEELAKRGCPFVVCFKGNLEDSVVPIFADSIVNSLANCSSLIDAVSNAKRDVEMVDVELPWNAVKTPQFTLSMSTDDTMRVVQEGKVQCNACYGGSLSCIRVADGSQIKTCIQRGLQHREWLFRVRETGCRAAGILCVWYGSRWVDFSGLTVRQNLEALLKLSHKFIFSILAFLFLFFAFLISRD